MAVTMSSFQAPPPHFLSTRKGNSQCKKAQETSKTFSTQRGDETPSSCPLMVLPNCPNTYWLSTRALFCSGAGGSGLGGKLSREAPCDPRAVRSSCGAGLHPRMGSRHGRGWWELRCPLRGGGRVPRVHTPTVVSPRGLYGGFLPAIREPRAIATEKRGRGALPGQRGTKRRHPTNAHTVRALDPLLVRQSPGVSSKCFTSKTGSPLEAEPRPDKLIFPGKRCFAIFQGTQRKATKQQS